MKNAAIAAGTGSLALVASLALSPVTAHAASLTSTTTTVTGPGKAIADQGVTFVAKVSPFKAGKPAVAATGTVAFVITGPSPVACTNGDTVTPSAKGKALCALAPGSLVASATSYTISASYAGDDNFATSSGSKTLTVGQVSTHLKLTDSGKPTSGAATTFTATLVGPHASLATGKVLFSISVSPSNKADVCAGKDLQPLSADVATCSLAPGWLKVAAAAGSKTAWQVSASYTGDENFTEATTQMSGSATNAG